MLRVFLQMPQLNRDGHMTYAGSETPKATDLHQPAPPEKNPAWDERNCSGAVPWDGLANSKKPHCQGHGADHPLYCTLPSGFRPRRSGQATAAEHRSAGGGGLGRTALRLAGRSRQGLQQRKVCPEAGGVKAKESSSL